MKRKHDKLVDEAKAVCIAAYYQIVTFVGAAVVINSSREQSTPFQKYTWTNFLCNFGNNLQFIQ